MPTETIVRRALAVDSYFLATIVFLLLVAALGFPFVKLVALDEHERFRLGDVMGLYVSTAALLALATLTIQVFDTSWHWRRVADQGLAQLWGRARARIPRRNCIDTTSSRRVPTEAVGKWSPARQLRRQPSTDWYGTRTPEIPVPDQPVHMTQASWIARDTGRQVWKITADPITSIQTVSQRVYFQSVRDGYLFTCGDSSRCGNAVGPFYVGPDRSVTDGKFYTFIAMPSRMNGERGGDVVSVTARLFSLSTPALPAGYGFAVINRAGRVLYHSDSRLSLREHLFDELSAGGRARALVYAGQTRAITSAYRESPHRPPFPAVSPHRLTTRVAQDSTS